MLRVIRQKFPAIQDKDSIWTASSIRSVAGKDDSFYEIN